MGRSEPLASDARGYTDAGSTPSRHSVQTETSIWSSVSLSMVLAASAPVSSDADYLSILTFEESCTLSRLRL